MNIKPLDDRVVIEPVEAEEKTAGGIVLPDAAREKQARGKIVAVGAGRLLETGERAEMSVAEGDEVFYERYGGTEVKVDGKEYMIMKESQILAKVN